MPARAASSRLALVLTKFSSLAPAVDLKLSFFSPHPLFFLLSHVHSCASYFSLPLSHSDAFLFFHLAPTILNSAPAKNELSQQSGHLRVEYSLPILSPLPLSLPLRSPWFWPGFQERGRQIVVMTWPLLTPPQLTLRWECCHRDSRRGEAAMRRVHKRFEFSLCKSREEEYNRQNR